MDFNSFTIQYPQKLDSAWQLNDYLGALKVRLSFGRNTYRVNPGLYRIGNPDKESEVLVTANYKLTFDIIRRTLKNQNVWLLILQTNGINVWCAAGKGTFGTEELVRQIRETNLPTYVSHKRIIVPQLGAPGVSAHRVKEQTGFNVKYGPVRANDIAEFINSGYKKTEQMRRVTFTMPERLVLTPTEISSWFKYYVIALVSLALVAGISNKGFSLTVIKTNALSEVLNLSIAYLSGTLLTPLLLPYLPFRAFSGKGIISALISYGILLGLLYQDKSIYYNVAWFCIAASVSSFLAMNFTGASTYTSLSGVQKEMKFFVPVQLILMVGGLALLIISKFK